MKVYPFLICFLSGLIALGCQNSGKQPRNSPQGAVTTEQFYDGIHCAEVSYYNPKTGRKSDYILEVEVEDGELTKILWPNGGWLDDDHFSPEELDEDGWCEIETDRGIEHEIQIIEDDCNFSNSSRINEDFDLEFHQMEREYLSGEEKRVYDEENGLEGYFDASEYEGW